MHLLHALCYIFTLIKLDKHILNKIFDFDLIKKESKINEKSEILNLKSKTMHQLFASNISIIKIKQIPTVVKDFELLSLNKSIKKNPVNFDISSNNVENSFNQLNANKKENNENELKIHQKGVE